MYNTKILYIEDEEDYRELVTRILQDAGYLVHVAQNAQEGLLLLEQENPDLLLLDIHLPDTDGFSFCRQLRQALAWKRLPVLMLTVLRDHEKWLSGFSSGATDYVSKPLNPPDFLERIQASLKKNVRHPVLNLEDAEYQLVQAAAAGNNGAFEVLIREYKSPLLRTISRLVSNTTDAEDIVSYTFMTALQSLKDFRGASSFNTWLHSIALKQVRMKWRRQASSPLRPHVNSGEDETPAKIESDLQHLEFQPLLATLRKAISAVPRPYRTALKWHLIDDWSYMAIAQQWGIRRENVDYRIRVGKRLLRRAWNQLNRSSARPI